MAPFLSQQYLTTFWCISAQGLQMDGMLQEITFKCSDKDFDAYSQSGNPLFKSKYLAKIKALKLTMKGTGKA